MNALIEGLSIWLDCGHNDRDVLRRIAGNLRHRIRFIFPESNDVDDEPHISKKEDDDENSAPEVGRENECGESLINRKIANDADEAEIPKRFIRRNILKKMLKGRSPECILHHAQAPEGV